MKSKRPWWAGNVNWYGETRNVYRFLMGKPHQEVTLEIVDGDGRIVLSWT
jgi:hypothetical protein